MKVLKLLYKYRYEVKLNKTKLFEFVNNGSKEIEQEGFVYKVKNPWDLFAYEVILKGIRAKKEIDECYNNFIANNYDLFEHINYKQRQSIFKYDINDFSKDIDIFIKLYGMQPYNSDFSSLQLVGKDQENEYLYHDDFKVVYQFKNNKIVNEICLVDKYTKKYPDLQNIKDVIDKIINQEDDKNILEYLYEHELIGEKTHKKIKRKLK